MKQEKIDKRAAALRENLKKRKALAKDKATDKAMDTANDTQEKENAEPENSK